MLKDITLGQFFPGDSIAHRLDARCKLLLVALYIAALFTAKGWISYALVLGTTVFMVAVSHIPPKALFRGRSEEHSLNSSHPTTSRMPSSA